MPTTLYVRPRPGHRVRDVATGQAIPESGALVADSVFWRRREAEGAISVENWGAFPETLDDYPPAMQTAMSGASATPLEED